MSIYLYVFLPFYHFLTLSVSLALSIPLVDLLLYVSLYMTTVPHFQMQRFVSHNTTDGTKECLIPNHPPQQTFLRVIYVYIHILKQYAHMFWRRLHETKQNPTWHTHTHTYCIPTKTPTALVSQIDYEPLEQHVFACVYISTHTHTEIYIYIYI